MSNKKLFNWNEKISQKSTGYDIIPSKSYAEHEYNNEWDIGSLDVNIEEGSIYSTNSDILPTNNSDSEYKSLIVETKPEVEAEEEEEEVSVEFKQINNNNSNLLNNIIKILITIVIIVVCYKFIPQYVKLAKKTITKTINDTISLTSSFSSNLPEKLSSITSTSSIN